MRSDLMRCFAEPVTLMVWSSRFAFRNADDAIRDARTIASDSASAERNWPFIEPLEDVDFLRCPEELKHSNRIHRASALPGSAGNQSEEHTSELQSRQYLVCRLLLEKK